MTPIAQFEKDPEAILDFAVDWSNIFGDDAIATAEATVPAGITLENESATATSHVIRLSGGTAGERYQVISRVNTTSGQRDERTIEIVVRQR